MAGACFCPTMSWWEVSRTKKDSFAYSYLFPRKSGKFEVSLSIFFLVWLGQPFATPSPQPKLIPPGWSHASPTSGTAPQPASMGTKNRIGSKIGFVSKCFSCSAWSMRHPNAIRHRESDQVLVAVLLLPCWHYFDYFDCSSDGYAVVSSL